MKEMLAYKGTSFEGKTVAISGSGNVAIYACEKATQLGAKVVTMSDSNGFIYDPNGINWMLLRTSRKLSAAASRSMLSALQAAPTPRVSVRGAPSATSLCRVQPRTS